MRLIFLFLVSSLSYNFANACHVSCDGGDKVKVDVAAKCMCISSNCFPINTGRTPDLTTDGSGVISRGVHGGQYETHENTSEKFDNDALMTGINADTVRGKWIHKAHRGHQCIKTGVVSTDGCVGVPCDHWDEMKAQIGQRITICKGAPAGSIFTKVDGRVVKLRGGRQ